MAYAPADTEVMERIREWLTEHGVEVMSERSSLGITVLLLRLPDKSLCGITVHPESNISDLLNVLNARMGYKAA